MMEADDLAAPFPGRFWDTAVSGGIEWQRMHSPSAVESWPLQPGSWTAPQRRNLAGACLAHLLHDGYTDQLYALLPIWQSQFGLSYAGLALVRALYYGTMGGLQVPGDRLISRLGPRAALTLSTFIAAAGFLLMAL